MRTRCKTYRCVLMEHSAWCYYVTLVYATGCASTRNHNSLHYISRSPLNACHRYLVFTAWISDVWDTGVSFQARMAMAAAAARRVTFAGSRLVSIPPCLRPIEEEESDAATTASSSSSSSSCDEMSFSDDELCTSNDDSDAVSQVATPTRHFDHVSSTGVSFHDSKHFEMCLMFLNFKILTLIPLSAFLQLCCHREDAIKNTFRTVLLIASSFCGFCQEFEHIMYTMYTSYVKWYCRMSLPSFPFAILPLCTMVLEWPRPSDPTPIDRQ